MPPSRNCGLEALDIDFAPQADPKVYAGSNEVLHDLRQGLVSPSTQPQTIRQQHIPRATQYSGTIGPNIRLRRVGAIRARRSKPMLHPSGTPYFGADDIAHAQASQSQRTAANSNPAQSDYKKLSRRQRVMELLQFSRSRLNHRDRDNILPSLKSATTFVNAREAAQKTRPSIQPDRENGDLNLQSASLCNPQLPSASEQCTRQTAPTTRRQLLADSSRHATISFSRKATFDQAGSDLDALTEAAGRLRLEEQVNTEGHSSFLAALRRKFGKDAFGEGVEAAVRSLVREFKLLKALGRGKLENEATPERGAEHADSTLPKQAGALCRRISKVQSLLGFLERSNQKVLKYGLVLRNMKQQATELVEQHHQHAIERREEHERAVRQTLTRLTSLKAKLDSIREETTRELLRLQENLEQLEQEKHT